MSARLKTISLKLMLVTAGFAFALSLCASICLSEARAGVVEKTSHSSSQHDCCSKKNKDNHQDPANTQHNCCQGHGAKYILEKQNLESPHLSLLFWIPQVLPALNSFIVHESKTLSLYAHPPSSLFKVALYLEECELLI